MRRTAWLLSRWMRRASPAYPISYPIIPDSAPGIVTLDLRADGAYFRYTKEPSPEVPGLGPGISVEKATRRYHEMTTGRKRRGIKTNDEIDAEARAALRAERRAAKSGVDVIGPPRPWAHRKLVDGYSPHHLRPKAECQQPCCVAPELAGYTLDRIGRLLSQRVAMNARRKAQQDLTQCRSLTFRSICQFILHDQEWHRSLQIARRRPQIGRYAGAA